jgi:nitrogen fixation/metabolism regulation signal transduction histidine kinase
MRFPGVEWGRPRASGDHPRRATAGSQARSNLVDDNGPGVPEAERQRVFDPYVTFRPGGTGLGLAIVRKIVIDHGGDVSAGAAPAPLGGARFVVELPC